MDVTEGPQSDMAYEKCITYCQLKVGVKDDGKVLI